MPEEQGQGGGGSSPAEIMATVGAGLQAITEGITGNQSVPDPIKQRITEVNAGYQEVMQALSGGGQEGQPPRSNAQPVQGPQGGRPMGPQGAM